MLHVKQQLSPPIITNVRRNFLCILTSFHLVVVPIIYRADDGVIYTCWRLEITLLIFDGSNTALFFSAVEGCAIYDCTYNRLDDIINTPNFERKASINPGSPTIEILHKRSLTSLHITLFCIL